jgi:tetratricopeptide (TPR) repeat protein
MAQVNQKDILLKEANRFNLHRQYEKAISLYLELLEQYPDDADIAERLISSYLLTSQLGKAEKLLDEKNSIFADLKQVELRVTLLLAQAKIDNAWKTCQKFLSDNSGRLNYYKTFAVLFQRYRQYNYAVDLLLMARNIAKDDYLYANELANNYYQISDHQNSIKEYLKHVEKNKAYKNYVQNKLKIILREDPQIITAIEEFSSTTENSDILEIYAVSLGETGNISGALEVYQKLSSDKLLTYAQTLKQSGDEENALLAYAKYLQLVNSPELIAESQLAIAQIYWKQKRFSEAENLLLQIYNSRELQSKQLRYKTRANRICREMLSDLALLRDEPKAVITYLQEASEFTYNQKEIKDIAYRMIHFKLMTDDIDAAEQQLLQVLMDEDPSSEIYKKGIYYKYLLSVMQADTTADSLLGELLINLPESTYTNDAIEISLVLKQLQDEDKQKFLEALRKDQIYKTTQAITLLEEIYQTSDNEQILILAGEWSLRDGDPIKAAEIFNNEFSDADLAQYALLMTTHIDNLDIDLQQLTENFLAANPRSVFAPEFRKLLSEK